MQAQTVMVGVRVSHGSKTTQIELVVNPPVPVALDSCP